MAESGFVQQPPGGNRVVIRDQNTTRQNAYGPFEHAHIAIEHNMVNAGSVKQCAHRRDQHRIVCPHQFAHVSPADSTANSPTIGLLCPQGAEIAMKTAGALAVAA